MKKCKVQKGGTRTSWDGPTLPVIVRKHPNVRRDLALLCQLDLVHRWFVSTRSAGTAAKRSFKLPYRRVARATDGIKRNAGAGLTTIALDFHPAVTAIKALPDRRRRLRRPAVTLHTDRPCFGLGAIRFADGFNCFFPNSLGADFGAADAATENDLAQFGAHDAY